jgi:hypothetical protein
MMCGNQIRLLVIIALLVILALVVGMSRPGSSPEPTMYGPREGGAGRRNDNLASGVGVTYSAIRSRAIAT